MSAIGVLRLRRQMKTDVKRRRTTCLEDVWFKSEKNIKIIIYGKSLKLSSLPKLLSSETEQIIQNAIFVAEVSLRRRTPAVVGTAHAEHKLISKSFIHFLLICMFKHMGERQL